MVQADDASSDYDAHLEKWQAKDEKEKQAGWVHSMCLKCFRKRWPHGIYCRGRAPLGYVNGRFAVSASRNTKTEFIKPVIR